MTINPKKTNKHIPSAKLGANAQRFLDHIEIGFETMSLEIPFDIKNYGSGTFLDPDSNAVGWGLCQLSLEIHDAYCAEETRVVCFEDGLHFANGAIFPFCKPPAPTKKYTYREQTPENLAMLIFCSIILRKPVCPPSDGSDDLPTYQMISALDLEDYKGSFE